jgi:hypothetical protein
MKRSGVSAEALFGYKQHQEQKHSDIRHTKPLRSDSLIETPDLM